MRAVPGGAAVLFWAALAFLTAAEAMKAGMITLRQDGWRKDVNFDHDVVQVRITPSLGPRLRQHTASLDLEAWDIGQLGDGTKDARPIFGRVSGSTERIVL